MAHIPSATTASIAITSTTITSTTGFDLFGKILLRQFDFATDFFV